MIRPALTATVLAPVLVMLACSSEGVSQSAQQRAEAGPFQITAIASFKEPWAMTFLPGGRQALITEKSGKLKLWTVAGNRLVDVRGVPAVAYGGQGGLGDVVLHPGFAQNGMVYLSFAEAGQGGFGAAVARGRMVTDNRGARLENMAVIWRQSPKVSGRGHYGHRIAFAPDGKLFISSGDRQKFTPAQDRQANLGKILRLSDDGSIPADNPFARAGGVTAQIWTLGHRNPLGIAFDAQGRLWEHEMGPKGGDEVNLIERGKNYGYPIVSNGDHYDGRPIPDHPTRPEFAAPATSWTPVISPAGLVIYSGTMFPAWRGNALIGGLSSEALIRVAFDGARAREVERFPMKRIREVEQGPDGAVYLLEDGEDGGMGRLLKLTAR